MDETLSAFRLILALLKLEKADFSLLEKKIVKKLFEMLTFLILYRSFMVFPMEK